MFTASVHFPPLSTHAMYTPSSPSVWIVDDDPDDQFLFSLVFKTLTPPVSVSVLNDGEELLPALRQCETLPSLLVLDINMPLLNGFDTLQQLRSTPAYQNLPVIVLTTSTNPDDQIKAMQVGADAFLIKPASSGKLLMLFNKLVPLPQLRQSG